MTLASGSRLGAYEVVSMLGAGGMGEVYRARDTKLGRDVAIKVMPDPVAADPDRLARFEREATTLASLNHPNIAAVYAVEGRAIVMELVAGEDLSELITERNQLAPVAAGIEIDDALSIARQIAGALEAAHDAGIIHRDLKPANIKIRPDGAVKILDFGLAKVMDPAGAPSADAMKSPTLTARATAMGTIVGTAAYMAPEQARGRAVDRRADVWAFGCVLFEMISGRRAFAGDTITDVLAAVVREEPDWSSLPASTPNHVVALLRKCLQKDPARRLRDMGDARLELDEPAAVAAVSATVPIAAPSRGRSRGERLAWLVASVVTLASLAAIFLLITFRPRAADALEYRIEITTPPAPDPMSFAVSPDGTSVAFVAQQAGQPRLLLRRLTSVDTRTLEGTEGAGLPFWSPDGKALGFFAESKLKRLDISGGPVQTLAPVNGARGGAWAPDGTVLFALVSGPIFRVPAAGGAPPVPLTKLLPRQSSHRFPRFLSDGRHFLYYAQAGIDDQRGIYLASLDQPEGLRLMQADSAAVPLDGGLILFVRQGTLSAQQLDLSGRRLTGDVSVVADDVAVDVPLNVAAFSAARGTLMYRTGRTVGLRRLVWFDRAGKRLGDVGDTDPSAARAPELSPDGRQVVLDRSVSGNTDVWRLDVERGVRTRLTFDTGPDSFAVWSPDGSRLVFSSARAGVYDMYTKSASGSGAEETLLKSERNKIPLNWTPDGRFLLYRVSSIGSYDLFALPMMGAGGDRTPVPVATSSFDEREGQFSPDGKWIAYQSNESGTFEIYVQPSRRRMAGGRYRREGACRSDGIRAGTSSSTWGSTAVCSPRPFPSAKVARSRRARRFRSSTRVPPGVRFPGRTVSRSSVARDGRFLAMIRPDAGSTSEFEVILNWRGK